MTRTFFHIQAQSYFMTSDETLAVLKGLGRDVSVWFDGLGWVCEFQNTYVHGENLSDVLYVVYKAKKGN